MSDDHPEQRVSCKFHLKTSLIQNSYPTGLRWPIGYGPAVPRSGAVIAKKFAIALFIFSENGAANYTRIHCASHPAVITRKGDICYFFLQWYQQADNTRAYEISLKDRLPLRHREAEWHRVRNLHRNYVAKLLFYSAPPANSARSGRPAQRGGANRHRTYCVLKLISEHGHKGS